jgi:hypothetical protein
MVVIFRTECGAIFILFDNRLIVYTDVVTKDYILRNVDPLQLKEPAVFTFEDNSTYTTDPVTEVVVFK